ncbi:uncharacterized protein LOC114476487 isoform X2 [Gouania willdenowi]|nr:uncharacterized protein LOC114476487 isoform X2 [Gouania willdenowi]
MSERRGQQGNDKATQTYWRPPSNPGVLPTPLLSPWQAQHQGLTRTSMPQRRQRVEPLVHYFTDAACLKYYSLYTPTRTSTRED